MQIFFYPLHQFIQIYVTESSYINKILSKMATLYARLKNQNKFKYHILISASFFKTNEEDQRFDEIE